MIPKVREIVALARNEIAFLCEHVLKYFNLYMFIFGYFQNMWMVNLHVHVLDQSVISLKLSHINFRNLFVLLYLSLILNINLRKLRF